MCVYIYIYIYNILFGVKHKPIASWIAKRADTCFDDTYLFSMHTTMTYENFLYLIDVIWLYNDICQKT